MKVFTYKPGLPIVIAVIVIILLSFSLLPGDFIQARNVGTGYSAMVNLKDGGLSKEQIREVAIQNGTKSGVFMILGKNIPITILALIVVGLISNSTALDFKKILWKMFIVTASAGSLFLSLYLECSGVNNYNFTYSSLASIVFYILISIIFLVIIKIGVAIREKYK